MINLSFLVVSGGKHIIRVSGGLHPSSRSHKREIFLGDMGHPL